MPAWLMILKGPKNFSESFFEGLVEWKNYAFTNTCWPTLNSRAALQHVSAGPVSNMLGNAML